MQIRSRYNLGAPEKGLDFLKPSLTQQQFKDECEIESLLKAHNLSQVMGIVNNHGQNPIFADVSDIPDFAESQNHISLAREYFESLPSSVRSHFDNSLPQFLASLNNPDAREALVSLGILKKGSDKVKDLPDGPSSQTGDVSAGSSGSESGVFDSVDATKSVG